jgi:AcrR family transcriptional regulator
MPTGGAPESARERLLRAAEDELTVGSIEDLTLRRIIARAGHSTTAPYRYFRSKDELVDTLFERFECAARAELESATGGLSGLPAADVVRAFMTRTALIFARHAGLLRALLTAADHAPTLRERARRLRQCAVDGMSGALACARDVEPETRSEFLQRSHFAARVALALLEHCMLFAQDSFTHGSDEEFARITGVVLAYLRLSAGNDDVTIEDGGVAGLVQIDR